MTWMIWVSPTLVMGATLSRGGCHAAQVIPSEPVPSSFAGFQANSRYVSGSS